MTILRGTLILAWLILAVVTFQAIAALGLGGANLFVDDFAHPWRAQFNTDFALHLLLMAAWIVYREPVRLVGILCGVGAILGGGFFSLAYILAATFRAKGNTRALLVGPHRV